MEPGRVGAREVGRAAGEDVERAATVAGEASLDRLDLGGVLARLSVGRPRAADGVGITQRADRPASRERVLRPQIEAPPPRNARRESPAVGLFGIQLAPARRAAPSIPPAPAVAPSPSAAARPHRHDAAEGEHEPAEPDPPDQRIDVEAVDRLFGALDDPAKTRYRSSWRSLRIPTSVDGSKVGRLKLSTCCRFSEVSRPAAFPSLVTSTVAAETTRLSCSYCEIPTWVKWYWCPKGSGCLPTRPA